jgi:hypothetical protein
VQIMMRIAVVALLLPVSGCGNFDRHVANITGSSESCIDGVKYIQFPSGASVKYTRDGRIATC